MNRSWIFLVARRYFRTRRRERGNTASLLSVVGIAVGVTTLIAVLAVMNGFQLSTIEAILEFNSYHLRVSSAEKPNEKTIEAVRSVPGVKSAFPFAEIQTLVRGRFSDPRACMLRALPEDIAGMDPSLFERLAVVEGRFDLSGTGNLIVGSELAKFLGVKLGDPVSLLNLAGSDFGDLEPENLTFRVVGIFKSGYYEYDLAWGFVSLEAAAAFLSPKDVHLTGIKLDDRFEDKRVESRIAGMLGSGSTVVSWRDYNRAIFGALRIEKIMMMILIGLIFVVVAVNIFQSLRRSVYERTEEIGVLKALGASPRSIRLIFVLEGTFIGGAGAFLGHLVGFLVAGRINEIFRLAERVINFFISLANALLSPYFKGRMGQEVSLFSPAYFYLQEVPSRVLFGEALFIWCFALLSTTLAAYFASARVASIKPAEVLRYE